MTADKGHLRVWVDGTRSWSLDIAEPVANTQLEVGAYLDARRYPGNGQRGNIIVSDDGRGCNTLEGQFAVDHVLYEEGVLNEAVVRFEQHCDGVAPALRGFFRYDADDPTPSPPAPPSSAFPWQPPADQLTGERTSVYLEPVGGSPFRYTSADADISVTATGSALRFEVVGDQRWWGNFELPTSHTTLVEGAYLNAINTYDHWTQPQKGALQVWMHGGSTCTGGGHFAIDKATYTPDGVLDEAIIRFEQHCGGSIPFLRGSMRYDKDAPTGPLPPPPPSAFGWQPPSDQIPADGNVFYIESDPGSMGSGRTFLYTRETSVFSVRSDRGKLSLGVHSDDIWRADFAQPTAHEAVITGAFLDLLRYPFHNPLKGGLDVSYASSGCGSVAGHFAVDHVAYREGALTEVVLRFEHHCEGRLAGTRGYLRYDVDNPTEPPPPLPASAYGWQPPADQVSGSGTVLYLESDAGDSIGRGRAYRYTPAEAKMTATTIRGHVHLWVRGDETWSFDVAEPSSYPRVVPAAFLDVANYPWHNPQEGGLDFSGEGRGCSEVSATFAVDRVRYEDEVLKEVEVRFEQHCEGATPALRGFFRYNADDPTAPPPPPPASGGTAAEG